VVCPVVTFLVRPLFAVFVIILFNAIYYFVVWSLALLEQLVDVRPLKTFPNLKICFPAHRSFPLVSVPSLPPCY